MKASFSKTLFGITFISAFYFMPACSKEGAGSPPLSVGKISAAKTFPGKNRVRLTWQWPSENNIKECRVSWNNGKDSLTVPIDRSVDTASVIINNLEEKDYTFSVKSYNQQGNTSAAVTITAHAYGSHYQESLHNRSIYETVYDDIKKRVNITWNDAETGAVRSEIKYKDSLGTPHSLFVSSYYSNTSLEGINAGNDSLFFYRTAFLPELTAIDTFYTVYDTIAIKFPQSIDDGSSYTHAVLEADGPGNTYELINDVLGGNAEETPDCAHPAFDRHITEEYNDELKKNVFAFYLHVTPDNDRCVNFDRQRCEIKTYGPSPDSVKAFNGDEMIFQWKFKLAAGFQPSYSFTHIHQLKAGDGPNDGSPIITITPRYGSPEKLEIIHTGDNNGTTLGKVKTVDLAPFKGTWIQATEKIKFGSHGTYQLTLKKVSDGTELLSYSDNDIDLWRTGSTFVRPKWGIYRSLNHPEQLRDEKVLFADFIIEKKQ